MNDGRAVTLAGGRPPASASRANTSAWVSGGSEGTCQARPQAAGVATRVARVAPTSGA